VGEQEIVVKDHSESGALVVGGGSGIGLATARALLEAGVPRLVVAGRDAARLDAAVASLRADAGGAEVSGVRMDAADADQAQGAVAEAEQRLGGIDVLVSSVAGAVVPQLLHDSPVSEVEAVLHGQLLPPLLLTRLVLPGMYERGGGSVVLIASDAAKVATPGETVIGAAMAGIVMFARATALEAKRRGVRVNALTPSLVAGTPTTDRVTAEGFSAKLFAAAARQAHLGVAEPEDVAALAVYLAGPAARRLTGQAISVNGGISAA
jgi:NAD(P)-dependent dehydrogenase (short-subunit alcohol dehydrogenase family)